MSKIYLNTSQRDSQLSKSSTDLVIILQKPFILKKEWTHATISNILMSNSIIPLVNENNFFFYVNNIPVFLLQANYTLSDLLSQIQTSLNATINPNFVVSINKQNKITITNPVAFTIIFDLTKYTHILMGFCDDMGNILNGPSLTSQTSAFPMNFNLFQSVLLHVDFLPQVINTNTSKLCNYVIPIIAANDQNYIQELKQKSFFKLKNDFLIEKIGIKINSTFGNLTSLNNQTIEFMMNFC